MSFSDDIKKFANKTNKTADEVAEGLFIKLFSAIIMDTRVDTGRLRGNWQLTMDYPATSETDREDLVPQYQEGGRAWSEVQSGINPQRVNYLTNNLPYAKRWEDVDGMVSTNIVRIKRTLREAIRDVTGQYRSGFH